MNEEQRGRLIKCFLDARRYLQAASGHGELTQGEFLVLRRIRIERENLDKPHNFRAIRISQYLGMPPPAVSRIFNTLEGKGFIVRQINEENRRSVVVILTKEGEKALLNAEIRVRKIITTITDELGQEDSLKLLELLERVVDVFDREILEVDDRE